MKYTGGKVAVGKKWAAIIGPCDTYWEPFCGMLGVGRHVLARRRLFSDSDRSVVSFLRALRDGWTPPTSLSEDRYYQIKEDGDEDSPIYAFAAFGCSFSGKRWGGFARDKRGLRNFAGEASRACVLLSSHLLKSDEFLCSDYRALEVTGASTVYCDPPYSKTTKVGQGHFSEAEFEAWLCHIKAGVNLFVSEYRDMTHLGMTSRSLSLIRGHGLFARKNGSAKPETLWSRLAA